MRTRASGHAIPAAALREKRMEIVFRAHYLRMHIRADARAHTRTPASLGLPFKSRIREANKKIFQR